MKRKLIPFLLPLFVLICAVVCRKPANLDSITLGEGFPVVSSVTLEDTLPAEVMDQLALTEKVTGIKVSYLMGREVRYFEYHADGDKLLHALSSLAFSLRASRSDMECRNIPVDEVNLLKGSISSLEAEQGDFFWSFNIDDVNAFECMKSPARHTLLVSKTSDTILHRVEIVG